MTPLVLDVGCGRRPRGNVNVDVSKEWTPYCYKHEQFRTFDYHQIPNFILASACNLPFRDKVFDRVVSFSVLEHIKTPFKALKEIVRVCKGEGDLYVPHRFGWSAKRRPDHVSFFNATWFVRAFKMLDVNDYQLTFIKRYLPHPFLPIFSIPSGIRIHFWSYTS